MNVSERRRGQHDESLDESVDDTEGMSVDGVVNYYYDALIILLLTCLNAISGGVSKLKSDNTTPDRA